MVKPASLVPLPNSPFRCKRIRLPYKRVFWVWHSTAFEAMIAYSRIIITQGLLLLIPRLYCRVGALNMLTVSFVKESDPTHPNLGCPGYDTKLHMMAMFHFWRFGECRIPLHWHYSQVHSDLVWCYLLGSHLWIK